MSYCYIIHVREFIKTGESIYKIGRTTQPKDKRLSQYPKGSIEKIKQHVSDCVKCEQEIKRVFDKKFKNCRDVGREYYEGDYAEMEKEFLKITSMFSEDAKTNTIDESASEMDVEVEIAIKEPSNTCNMSQKNKKKGYYLIEGYHCNKCNHFTLTKSNMNKHIKTVKHCKLTNDNVINAVSKKYKCDKCLRLLNTKYSLEFHKENNCKKC